eukprot:1426529-Amphidinium_carterae.1
MRRSANKAEHAPTGQDAGALGNTLYSPSCLCYSGDPALCYHLILFPGALYSMNRRLLHTENHRKADQLPNVYNKLPATRKRSDL